jgi:hypothetical protein
MRKRRHPAILARIDFFSLFSAGFRWWSYFLILILFYGDLPPCSPHMHIYEAKPMAKDLGTRGSARSMVIS